MARAALSSDEVAAFQAKVMDVMWAEMKPEQMGQEMAQAYAEVFTPAELRGMAEFYATAAGQATIEKAPEIQQRLVQAMMPRMMAAMPKVQQMSREFAEQQRLKRQQSTPPPAGDPASTSGAPAAPAPAP